MHRQITLCCVWLLSSLAAVQAQETVAAPPAAEPAMARIAATGDFDTLHIGQQGYCGKRSFVPEDQYKRIMVRPNETAWVSVYKKLGTLQCKADGNFKPEAGAIYVIRFVVRMPESCGIQLFRVTDDTKLLPLRMEGSERESCPLF